MARYYYDRYGIRSSTSYYWSKYAVSYVYGAGTWGSQKILGSYPDGFLGECYSFTFDHSTGYYDTADDGGVIYPEGGGTVYSVSGRTLTRYYYSSTTGNNTVYYNTRTSTLNYTNKGDLIGGTWSSDYYYKTSGAVNSDGYWWERGSSSTDYYRGSYIDTIVAELGTYPANGRSGSYWYVLGKRAFPDFKIRQGGQLKSSVDGWARVNGQLKQIQQMWVRVNGQLKEV